MCGTRSPSRCPCTCCFPKGTVRHSFWYATGAVAKRDVQQGTLALMVLKTLEVLGAAARLRDRPAHRTDQRRPAPVNQGTLYPVLLKLEQEGAIASEWGTSENNRRARFYELTPPAAAGFGSRRRSGPRRRR